MLRGDLEELFKTYKSVKERIEQRFREFDTLRKQADDSVFLKELIFCLLTPQSKARTCAEAVERLFEHPEFPDMDIGKIAETIHPVRFKNMKAGYIKSAIERFSSESLKSRMGNFQDPQKARKWLVQNVKGMGMKEASHFLRNTGYGYDLAILDRHILKNLAKFGVIEMPATLTEKRYLEIEGKMRKFCEETGIPMHHMDFLLWYIQTGDIFK